ncbi:MAG: hypothetical protein WCY30_04990 [Candidatus Neomarinimicrobiota bacterium]|nr:hypothetical protein [Candidatus Neomarinimicrobiota bacterium]
MKHNPIKRPFLSIIAICFLLIFSQLGFTQDISDQPVRIYQLWDWITYKYSNHPTSLTEGDEFIYFGTSGGVYAFHKYGRYWTEPHTTSNGLSDDFITAVFYDNTTTYLWAAHNAGISYLTPASQRWTNISKKDLNLPESNQIIRLGTDGKAIWIQAEGGYLFTINKILGYFQEMQSSASDAVVWQPSAGDGVPDIRTYSIDQDYLIDGRGLILDRDLREYRVTIFFNSNIDIYGGIDGLGLFEGNWNIKTMHLRPSGPMQNYINAVATDNRRIWLGGIQIDPNPIFSKSGISCFDYKDANWSYHEDILINELATAVINDLAYRNNRLWIGTDQGLSIYDQKKTRWKRLSMSNGLSDEIVTTIALEDTLAWIGTPRGLSLVSIPSLKARRQKLAPRQNILRIFKIDIDSKKIWIATDNGLYSVDKFNHNVEHYDMFGTRIGLDDAVAGNFTAIGCGESQTVFGRYHALLQYSYKDDKWTDIPLFEQLNGATFYDIAIYDNYMWIGTDRGAFLMRLSDYYCENYTTVDGLAGNHVFKIIVNSDWVWFATDRGLTKYEWSKYVSLDE